MGFWPEDKTIGLFELEGAGAPTPSGAVFRIPTDPTNLHPECSVIAGSFPFTFPVGSEGKFYRAKYVWDNGIDPPLVFWGDAVGPIAAASGFDLAGLEAYYTLDETDTNNRADSHGANTLTAGATMSEAAGKIGNAASFPGSSSVGLLSIADNASLSFGDEDFSIAGWIQINGEGESSFVISKESVTTREYLLYHSVAAHKLSLYVGADTVQADSFGALSTGTWYFFYVEHDATANTLRISINDGTKDSAAHSGGATDGTAPFRMGVDFAGTSSFNGLLDEVSVWRRKLTDAEVTALYNGGVGRTYPF